MDQIALKGKAEFFIGLSKAHKNREMRVFKKSNPDKSYVESKDTCALVF